ncbi:hypothetical protein K505DRAFT_80259 [Melanomma pulvis-pyrius CBS 109.77]|uniref:Uncharacterized protein n=1 Tax=Melanomma pulvis-pyrius CBS 109.77 TaxID=1314802 RepID=A0A6A6XR61_9PLEO|nr:hypothetical protein K505DRAFT_80259 [Melanomma pulvis-pyrius CBS 109.77]
MLTFHPQFPDPLTRAHPSMQRSPLWPSRSLPNGATMDMEASHRAYADRLNHPSLVRLAMPGFSIWISRLAQNVELELIGRKGPIRLSSPVFPAPEASHSTAINHGCILSIVLVPPPNRDQLAKWSPLNMVQSLGKSTLLTIVPCHSAVLSSVFRHRLAPTTA